MRAYAQGQMCMGYVGTYCWEHAERDLQCVCVGTRELTQGDVHGVGGNWHVHVLGAACTKQGAVPALLALHTETYEGSPPGHPAEGFGELRALHLQLLQELGGQADVHGQGEALADILQRGARE